jgi:phosphatidylserine/phosphatidylglycerophosphate/cardiolipin synthase-like enzyme
MAKFLTTSWVSSYIEDIIKNAKEEVVLVSPYLQLSQSFYERLKDAQDHDVNIIIVYGKSELSSKETALLEKLPNLSLYFSKNLHAKCYFNESSMVITSMNMYEYSEKNNREMGVYITKNEDNEIYEEASKETQSIIRSSDEVQLSKTVKSKRPSKKSEKPKKNKKSKVGNCIRCSANIPLNIESPYCKKCYKSWSFYENIDFEEKVCHSCGDNNDSTIVKPVCYSCYKTLN